MAEPGPSFNRSDSKSEEGELSPPRPKKTRKIAGAATYKTKVNPVWKKEFPFITSVTGDLYR